MYLSLHHLVSASLAGHASCLASTMIWMYHRLGPNPVLMVQATSAKAGASLHAKHCIALQAIAVSQAAVLCYRRLFSRKKAAQRAKRMAGQGLGTWGVTAPLVKGAPAGLKPPTHSRHSQRDSPTYDYHSRSALHFCSLNCT